MRKHDEDIREVRHHNGGTYLRSFAYAQEPTFKERMRIQSTRHGMANSPEYLAWINMRQRCHAKSYRNWPRYGGRGIKICDQWVESFERFLSDMGLRPTGEHSLDRINLDGDYTPDNCRWATRAQQMNNMRRNRMVTLNGQTKSMADWARVSGIHRHTIRNRLNRGWNEQEAIWTPESS